MFMDTFQESTQSLELINKATSLYVNNENKFEKFNDFNSLQFHFESYLIETDFKNCMIYNENGNVYLSIYTE